MELRDGSIVLRPWREDDADAVYRACQDPEIQHWIPVLPRPYTHDDARAFVRGEHGLGRHQFAIEQAGEVVGSIGIGVDESRTGQIGYWCTSDMRGRGITTRALRRLARYASDELGLERLELSTDPANVASQRVATKAGFRREETARLQLPQPDGRRRDSVRFSLSRGR